MKLAFNGSTTMKATLSTDIAAASAAGFEFLEIWAAKLYEYLKVNSTADLKALFARHGIRPLSINSIEHITFRTPADYSEIRRECDRLSRIAAELACPYIVVVPGKMPPGHSSSAIVAESAKVLCDLAEIARRYHVKLAFEFLGEADCSVRTLEHCVEIIRKTDREDVGFVIDTFHFFTGGSTLESIRKIDSRKLFLFHINGAEDLPKGQLTDANRLYPGEGVLPIRDVKNALAAEGFCGVASVEIFRPQYWDEDPLKVAKKAKSAAENALEIGHA